MGKFKELAAEFKNTLFLKLDQDGVIIAVNYVSREALPVARPVTVEDVPDSCKAAYRVFLESERLEPLTFEQEDNFNVGKLENDNNKTMVM